MGDYADDAWDPTDSWSWTDRTRHDAGMHTWRHKPRTVCKFCGTKKLHWQQDDSDRWYLADIYGERHQCGLSFKSLIGRKPVDSDPDLEYNAYLDSIPSWTEEEYKDVFRQV